MHTPKMKRQRLWCCLCLGLLACGEARVDAARGAGARADGGRVAEAPAAAEALRQLTAVNAVAAARAIEDLALAWPGKYDAAKHRAALAEFIRKKDVVLTALNKGDAAAAAEAARLAAGVRTALLANPLLAFDRLLLVKREASHLGLPQNWQGNCALSGAFDNEIAVLAPVRPDGKLTTLFKPEQPVFVGDVDLHFDASRLLFSMRKPGGSWQVWEIKTDGTGLRQVTPDLGKDVNNYDACYLPDGRILFDSTACVAGVPCVGGGTAVANLFRMDADGTHLRQLCFDQDHNWSPAVLNDGRVLYTRWEYADIPHYFSRLLFRMNPDGTGQAEYYGSNSYWPNSIFYARPIPGHPTKVVAVISGHHGVPRMGELVLFDPARGRQEADGAVQRIPGFGQKVEPLIRDTLVDASWPKFLHPYPLSEKYFLASCKPSASAPWGLYLVDIFDNLTPILEMPGQALFEPIPLRPTPRPPVIPDRIKPESREATVLMTDVYSGAGLRGVPRGTVKSLRILEYHFAYRGMGGHISIGIDGPWDVHRIVGTVPVAEDGSASFKVPANMPLALQPLDAQGRAVQVMRSWFTAMPGEAVTCVGCHEQQNSAAAARECKAQQQPPVDITPWRGPARGFSFKREVQPVLDKYCVGCHDGRVRTDGQSIPNFAGVQSAVELAPPVKKANANAKATATVAPAPVKDKPPRAKAKFNFDTAYVALHPFIHRPGPENDYHLPRPYEWHASTSELIQMLEKGHHGVQLDAEAWDRLVTWIDLNVPDHGTWGEHRRVPGDYHAQRLALRTQYANRPEDPEEIVNPYEPGSIPFVAPAPEQPPPTKTVSAPGWPFDATEAKKRQTTAGLPPELKLELGTNALALVLIPAGEFVMGNAAGAPDEGPPCRVNIAKPFYLGKFEVSNAQFQLFDPDHDSGFLTPFNKDHSSRGLPLNGDGQPVVRVSWQRAMAYCEWLSRKTGKKCSLPTEAQWEWACRAGTATPLAYGEPGADFGRLANLADASLSALTTRDSPKWLPRMDGVNDGATATAMVGKYLPNAWGLYDMCGNAAEWTRTTYQPYPYQAADGRDTGDSAGRKVVRGGSFYDRPYRATSAYRLAYLPQQPVFNVGFRVVVED